MEAGKWQVAPDTTVQVVDPIGAEKEGGPEEEDRNWASIIISLSMIFFVLLMVTIATLLMGPQDPPFFGRRLVMADLFNDTLRPKPMPYQWLQGDKLAYLSEGAGVRLLDLETGSNVTLVTELAMRQTEAVQFSVSPDRRFVLLCHDVIKGRLYTRTALYSVYDVDTNHYYPLTLRNDHSTYSGLPLRLQHVEWATQHSNTSSSSLSRGRGLAEDRPLKGGPSRDKDRKPGPSTRTLSSLASFSTGHSLIILSRGAVFFMASPSAEPINLSPDADPDTLTYGAPDLLYQEILQEDAALWQSPTGHALLIASFNDSGVGELPVLRYAGGYPTVQALRYPTVGTPLPEVSLWLYDLTSPHFPPSRTRLLPPPSLQGPHYLTGGGWADGGRVWASWVGRDQASSALTLCSAPYWFCSTVLLNHCGEGVSPVVRGVQWAGKWAAFPWAAKDSLGSWHNHVALVGEAGGTRAPLTSPHYHVDHVMAANLDTQLVYFTGTVVSEMRAGRYNDQVYRASADGSNVTCVTCHLKNKNVRFSEELEDEDEDKKTEMTSSGRAVTPWDEWTDAIRDIYHWKNWGERQSYDLSLNDDKEEINRDYDVGKSDLLEDGDADEYNNRSEEENDDEENEEEEIGVNGQVIYNKCHSVRATLSPSSRYLVAVCLDDNGVPPSLWLLDLGQSSVVSSGSREKQEEEFGTAPRHRENIYEESSSDEIGNRDGHFERQENHHGPESSRHSLNVKQYPPLLLHSQTATRLSMGILGMPSTIHLGMSVGGGLTRVGVDATRGGSGGHQSAQARISLTLPPGWIHDDTTLLYPLVVQIVSPDESPSSRLTTEHELGLRWAEYLSSGHQVAHARIELWGSDPSAHTSVHLLAEHHLDAINQLLQRCPYLDGRHLAVYGRGGGGASVAMEAAALAPSLIRCVTLVNPITDWQAHGVYWSERLLGPPSQEGAEQRYVESNIARLAPEFRNSTPILLVHGTSDQFAHHGFSLAHALNEHAAHFSHVVYPDASLGLSDEAAHLLQRLNTFLFSGQCLPDYVDPTEE